MDPKTVPWGTPEVTGAGLDLWPSTNTCCVLLARKLLIHWSRLPRIP